MKPILLLLLSFIFLDQPKAQPLDVLIQRFDQSIDSLNQLHEFNGTYLLAKDGKQLFRKSIGFSDSTMKENLARNSAFNLASVSKNFTAALVMMMKDDGKLSFDDAVVRFIPEFPYPTITIRHLLNHTHGMIEYFDWVMDTLDIQGTIDNQRLLSLLVLHKPKLKSVPGERFDYCNTGYAVLASVLERSSGLTYRELLRKRIIDPVNMKNSFVYTVDMPKSPVNRVMGMKFSNNQWHRFDLTTLDGVVGDGNIYSTVDDLLKWDQALRKFKLIRKETMAEAYTAAQLKEKPRAAYGFGWIINDQGKKVSHSGSWNGFKSNFVRDLQHGYTFIFLSIGTAGMPFWQKQLQFEKAIAAINN
ncbi:MAG: serine hydrolase domain-containing protein [Bacteroidota bacterium]